MVKAIRGSAGLPRAAAGLAVFEQIEAAPFRRRQWVDAVEGHEARLSSGQISEPFDCALQRWNHALKLVDFDEQHSERTR